MFYLLVFETHNFRHNFSEDTMARKNDKKKTKYNSIYEIETAEGQKNYIANFSHLGKRYGDRNLTKLFGSKTALQAFNKLNEIKVAIASGQNPFVTSSLKINDLISKYFAQLKSRKSNSQYVAINTYVYEKHIQPIIGHLFIEKVTIEHINKIIALMQSQGMSSASIRKIKTILNPIFHEAYLQEDIKRNILDLANFGKKGSSFKLQSDKEQLTHRVGEPVEEVAKKLYHAAMQVENLNYRAAFLLSIMCARRIGEIRQLNYEDIDFTHHVIKARKETTKTNVQEHYPLPVEVKEALHVDTKKTGRIFTFWDTTFHDNYKKNVVNKSNIKIVQGEKITSHDNRTLFLSIGRRKFPYELVDKALSHKQGTIAEIYTVYEENELTKVYDAYWEILRS